MSKFNVGDSVKFCESSRRVIGNLFKRPDVAKQTLTIVSIEGDNGKGDTLYRMEGNSPLLTKPEPWILAESHLVSS